MRIVLLCVGKPRDRAVAGLHDLYAARIRRLGASYEARSVPEVKPGGRFTDEHVRERETRLLLDALDGEGTAVALDRSGKPLTSDELAERLPRWAMPRATFIVGGPLGLHLGLLDRAGAVVWSLSPLTFPHEMVRLLVAEQLYRALTIVRRIPYHK